MRQHVLADFMNETALMANIISILFVIINYFRICFSFSLKDLIIFRRTDENVPYLFAKII